MTALLQDLLAWVTANPTWAHLAVFLVALVESLAVVGLIVPGVIMMLGAGALVATGALQFWPVCLWAVAGAVAGDGLSYWLGRHFQDRLATMWPFSRYPESLDSGVRFFAKYGGKSVAFGRFVGPVRAVIPMVAGMMGMPPGRFLVANVLSAVAWAPAYLLPGIVFGASLELAAEAAVRLVALVLALVVVLWLAAWAVQQLFLLLSPRAGRWVEGLLRWADVHPRAGEIARALADPGHRDAKTLATLAALLIVATLLFALITGIAVSGAPELRLNQLVRDLGLSLHAPAANHLMAAFSRLADLAVILPLVIAVCVLALVAGRTPGRALLASRSGVRTPRRAPAEGAAAGTPARGRAGRPHTLGLPQQPRPARDRDLRLSRGHPVWLDDRQPGAGCRTSGLPSPRWRWPFPGSTSAPTGSPMWSAASPSGSPGWRRWDWRFAAIRSRPRPVTGLPASRSPPSSSHSASGARPRTRPTSTSTARGSTPSGSRRASGAPASGAPCPAAGRIYDSSTSFQ